MIPHIPKIATFSPEEINIIETQLQQQKYPTQPTEIQLCQMAQLIQQKHFRDANSLDVAVYLRQKLQNLQRPQLQPIPIVSENQGSIFKQFAEIKVEFPQKNKDYVCKSRRKVRPSLPVEYRSLEETVQIMDSNTAQCRSQFQKRGRKAETGQAVLVLDESCTWVYHELFYSSIDKNYLQEDELMVKLLRELQMIPQRLTYFEHRMIRRALPSPRKFTTQFVSQQIDRLNQIRAQLRISPRQRGKEPELRVNKQVIALHPVCGHLHSGSILAIYKENLFMVKFNRPELGAQKVLDILLAAKQVSSPHKVIVDNMDFEIMGLAIRLLQLKTDLLKLMKKYNIKACELQARQESLDNLFFQEYGWIGSTINILSLGIRHVISKFRVRGLNQSNQERVGRHFSSILINPLAIMEKQLQKSSEPSDIFASKQIKNIISTHRETRTEFFTKEIFTKQKVAIDESQLQEQKKEIMDKALKAMIGILVSLRYESRNFSVEQNKYVTELMGSIDSSHAEYINEIYQFLHSITGKIGAEIK